MSEACLGLAALTDSIERVTGSSVSTVTLFCDNNAARSSTEVREAMR